MSALSQIGTILLSSDRLMLTRVTAPGQDGGKSTPSVGWVRMISICRHLSFDSIERVESRGATFCWIGFRDYESRDQRASRGDVDSKSIYVASR